MCGDFSYNIICDNCQKLLTPGFYKNDDVISFYKYEDIEFLIKYKYKKFGDKVIKYLSRAFYKFGKYYPDKLNIIPIDDNPKKGFSHTAILARAMKKHKIFYNTLRQTSNVSYAGKSLEFRLNNPRDFIYTGPENIDVVLIDDVLTTGSTVNEAKELLKKYNVNVLFTLVLADLRNA